MVAVSRGIHRAFLEMAGNNRGRFQNKLLGFEITI
jgi:hypothetical protein